MQIMKNIFLNFFFRFIMNFLSSWNLLELYFHYDSFRFKSGNLNAKNLIFGAFKTPKKIEQAFKKEEKIRSIFISSNCLDDFDHRLKHSTPCFLENRRNFWCLNNANAYDCDWRAFLMSRLTLMASRRVSRISCINLMFSSCSWRSLSSLLAFCWRKLEEPVDKTFFLNFSWTHLETGF